jgi:hypothetical protein
MNIPGFCNTQRHDDASITDMRWDFSAGNPLDEAPSVGVETAQNPLHDVNVVPQLDMADFAATIAPYSPTWAHPYARFPEPNMGLLGELPPELFRILIASVPLADAAALGLVSRSMSAILSSTSSPYASLLPLVAQAWTDDIDTAHVVRMLMAMEAMPLGLRPAAFRAVASMLLVRARISPEAVLADTAWDEAITRTRDLVRRDCDPEAQRQMVVDLEVAAWHALDFCSVTLRRRRKADCWAWMQLMPSECWPPVLDAAVFRLLDLTWLDMKAIVADDTIRFRGISDRVAVDFARRPELLTAGLLMSDMMHTRFGLTLSQYERLLRPIEAARLATLWRYTNDLFSDFWIRYPTSDRLLIEMTERVALEDQLEGFWRTGSARVPPDAAVRCGSGDVAAINEVARWKEKFSVFYCAVESAACRSLGNAKDGVYPALSLTDVYTTVVEDLQNRQNLGACLTYIFSQPLGFQPVLLDRWAQAFRPDVDNTAYFPLLAQVSAWRMAVTDAFISRNEPINAVRACVAELRSFFNISSGDKDAVAQTFNAVMRLVFEAMPSETWGAMLSYMNVMSLQRGKRRWIDEIALHRRLVTFLRNPRAELRESSNRSYSPYCSSAGPIFDELPDQASETASKFENFCDRMGIPLRYRASAKTVVLIGIGKKIPKCASHLCTVIRAELKKAGFDDDESFRYVLLNKRL